MGACFNVMWSCDQIRSSSGSWKTAGLSCRTASKVRFIPGEDINMHRFLILSALALSFTLIGPVVGRAEDANHHDKRYYDRSGKDYHTWNNNEDRAYRSYLQEQHQDYREFNRV